MTVKRMDNVGVAVESLDETISFFTGLGNQCVENTKTVTRDDHSQPEMSRFIVTPADANHRSAPENVHSYLRVMFTVEDTDDTLAWLDKRGAELVGEVVQLQMATIRLSVRASYQKMVYLGRRMLANHHHRFIV